MKKNLSLQISKKIKDAGATPDSANNDAHVEDDVVIVHDTTLEKIGDISEQLKSILTRLNKLDTIENSVRNIEKNLANLKVRTAKLEEFELTAKKEIRDLKESYDATDEQLDDLQKQLENLNKQMEKEENLQEQINELTSKNLYLESYSRRDNIIFFSIPEEKDTEEALRNFMNESLATTSPVLLN